MAPAALPRYRPCLRKQQHRCRATQAASLCLHESTPTRVAGLSEQPKSRRYEASTEPSKPPKFCPRTTSILINVHGHMASHAYHLLTSSNGQDPRQRCKNNRLKPHEGTLIHPGDFLFHSPVSHAQTRHQIGFASTESSEKRSDGHVIRGGYVQYGIAPGA